MELRVGQWGDAIRQLEFRGEQVCVCVCVCVLFEAEERDLDEHEGGVNSVAEQ